MVEDPIDAPQFFQCLGQCDWHGDLVALYRTSWETSEGQPLNLPKGWQWQKVPWPAANLTAGLSRADCYRLLTDLADQDEDLIQP